MANSKIITYDLCAPGRNYDNLISKIKDYGICVRICESTWFISTQDSCVDVRNNLQSALDVNDRIFVAELTGTAAWHNVLCDNNYLKNNL